MRSFKLILLVFTSIILYSLGRPNLIFFEGIPKEVRYIGPFLEICGLALLFFSLSLCKNWKSRVSITYIFALGSAILTFNGFWLGVEKLTGFSFIPRVLIFLLFSLLQYPHLLLFSIIFKKVETFRAGSIVLFFSLVSIVEWFNPGFDTIQIGQTWIEYAPNINLATIFGLPIFTFFNLIVAWMIFKKVEPKYILLVSVLFISSNWRSVESVQKGNKLLIVQTNQAPYANLVKIHGKTSALKIIDKSISEAIGAVEDITASFIILPETIYPLPLNPHKEIVSQMTEFLVFKKLLERNITVGFGAPTEGRHDHFERYYNSFWVINSQSEQRYDKRVLMPLAESPIPVLGENMTNLLMKRRDYIIPGTNVTAITLPTNEKFLVDICFDGDVPFQMRHKILENPKVDFIVNVANDAWFNPSSQAFVHLWRVRWISALFEIPTVRASNGGVSASIKWDGTIADFIPNGEIGTKEVDLWHAKRNNFIFLKWGIFPFILLVLLIWGIFEFKNRSNKNL